MFVVVTGLDGSGTSSVAKILSELDKNSGLFHTPGEEYQNRQAIDDSVRETSQMAHYLYYLSSVVFASDKIKKEYDTKKNNVYCVRYLIDTVVSHTVAGMNVKLDYDMYNILKPDLTIFVKTDENIRQKRISARGKSKLDKVLDDDQKRLAFRKNFLRLLYSGDNPNVIIFNNDSENIHENVEKLFKKIKEMEKEYE